MRGYTQEDVIDGLDSFHLISYQRFESKNPPNMRVYNLYQIAEFLKVSIDELMK